MDSVMIYSIASLTMTVLLAVGLTGSLRKLRNQQVKNTESRKEFKKEYRQELLTSQKANAALRQTVKNLQVQHRELARQMHEMKNEQSLLKNQSNHDFTDAIRRIEQGMDVSDLVDSGALNKAEAKLIEQMYSH